MLPGTNRCGGVPSAKKRCVGPSTNDRKDIGGFPGLARGSFLTGGSLAVCEGKRIEAREEETEEEHRARSARLLIGSAEAAFGGFKSTAASLIRRVQASLYRRSWIVSRASLEKEAQASSVFGSQRGAIW